MALKGPVKRRGLRRVVKSNVKNVKCGGRKGILGGKTDLEKT